MALRDPKPKAAAKRKAAAAPKSPAANPKAAAAAPRPTKRPMSTRAVDPHRLVKRDDGYVSADGRFEVSGTPGSFYLADAARPNPFGLPTIDGPYRTLTELRAAVAAAVADGGTRG